MNSSPNILSLEAARFGHLSEHELEPILSLNAAQTLKYQHYDCSELQ